MQTGGGAVRWRTAPSCGTAAAWPRGQGQPRAGGCKAAMLRPPAHAQDQLRLIRDGASQPQRPPPQHPASRCSAPHSCSGLSPLSGAGDRLEDSRRGRAW